MSTSIVSANQLVLSHLGTKGVQFIPRQSHPSGPDYLRLDQGVNFGRRHLLRTAIAFFAQHADAGPSPQGDEQAATGDVCHGGGRGHFVAVGVRDIHVDQTDS